MKFSKGAAGSYRVADAGGLVLVGTAGAAFAAEVDGSDVDVNTCRSPRSWAGS